MNEGRRLKPELAATAGCWLYVSCHALVKFPGREGVIVTGLDCEACGNTNLRFFHTLEHEETNQQISVGIECAQMLLDTSDWEIPRLAENEVKRKERWRVHYRRPGRCSVDIDDLMKRNKL